MTKLLPAFLTLEQEEILGFTLSLSFSIFPFPSLEDLLQILKWPKEKVQSPIKPT